MKVNKSAVAQARVPAARQSSNATLLKKLRDQLEVDVDKSFYKPYVMSTPCPDYMRMSNLQDINENACVVIETLEAVNKDLKGENNDLKGRVAHLELDLASKAAELAFANQATAWAADKLGMTVSGMYKEMLASLPALDESFETTCPEDDDSLLPAFNKSPAAAAAVLAPPCLAPLAEEPLPCPAASLLGSPKALLSLPACAAVEETAAVAAVVEVAAEEVAVPAVIEKVAAVAAEEPAQPIKAEVTKAPKALKKTASKAKPAWRGVMDDEPLRQSCGKAKFFCQKFEVSVDPYGDNIFPEACGISAGAAAAPAASLSPRGSSSGSICGSERSCGLGSQASWSSESLASYGLNTSTGLFNNGVTFNGSGCGKTPALSPEGSVGALSSTWSSSSSSPRLSWGGSSAGSCSGGSSPYKTQQEMGSRPARSAYLANQDARVEAEGASGLAFKLGYIEDPVPEKYVVAPKAPPKMLRQGGGSLSFARTTRDQAAASKDKTGSQAVPAASRSGTSSSSTIKGRATQLAADQAAAAPKKPVSPATAKALARKAAAAGGGAAAPAASAKAAVRGSKPTGWKK